MTATQDATVTTGPTGGREVVLSLLDLAMVGPGETVTEGLAGCVETARLAERLGYERIWYAEHHNMASIASSATAVLIAHVAAHTEKIRIGSGGIMLPNHSPLTIAEQFGTLAALHPGRIDLGLGRAPGTDQVTVQAMRRDARASDQFPRDVVELLGYLSDESRVAGVEAIPGRGTHVPVYILGSSLFGAELAAILGLPFGFASHFSPNALQQAVALYRDRFEPSQYLDEPWVIAGANLIAAETTEEAIDEFERTKRARVKMFLSRRGQVIDDSTLEQLLESPQGQGIVDMMRYTGVGSPEEVSDWIDRFAEFARADELMCVFQGTSRSTRLRSLELTARARHLVAG